ncbi:hypothetical protein Esti_000633 [Eimeria stiedai]
MMALMEVSGYCYIPGDMQGLRMEAGEAVRGLIENAHIDLAGCRLIFVQLEEVIRRVCNVPPVEEKVSASKYKGKLTMHWGSSRRALSPLKYNLLDLLKSRHQALRLASALQQRPILEVQEHELPGARPRGHTVRAENPEAAEDLGWGPGEMPYEFQESMKALEAVISKMAKVLETDDFLEPQRASSLAVVVAS